MLDFMHAAVIALQRNEKYDYYQEFENLFIFSIKDAEETIGGFDAPLLINRITERVTNHLELIDDDCGNWLDNVIVEGNIIERMDLERPTSPMHGARYALEHRIIPQYLYEDGLSFMSVIVSKENPLSKVLIDLLREDGIENPYGETPVSVEPFQLENILIARIVFPEPEEEPLCYESYAFFDTENKRAAYYCLEKGGAVDDRPFLCGWSEAGNHLNFNNCSFDRKELIANMLRLFLDPAGEKTPALTASYSPKNGKVDSYLEDDSDSND